MPTAIDRTFPAPDTLPESVVIGGFRYDVRVPDQAMLDDPKLATFIDGLPGVFTPTPMDHGGSVWLHPDHGPDVLEHVVIQEEAYLAALAASKLHAKARLAQRESVEATKKYEQALDQVAAYDVLGGPF